MHYRHWVGRNRGNKTSSLQPRYRNAISCQSLCFGGCGGQNRACDNVSANSQAKVSWDPKPPKATAKPYSRHILGIYSGVQSHPQATPKLPSSQLIRRFQAALTLDSNRGCSNFNDSGNEMHRETG